MTTQTRINDFVVKFANVNGSGSASANGMFAKSILRMGVPVAARNKSQDLYVSGPLKTGRIMAKDEDMCLHCGLCAERCPTGAWDMQKFMYVEAQASRACLVHHDAYLR